ncbi:MAG TPA: M42 family peptidase [Candidatus Omnitrophota bacterium]|nr:M42 family peptidase [Candidatus Omnitrophota bacterium]
MPAATDSRDGSTADWLRHITSLPGVPGHEHAAAPEIASAFGRFADRVTRDPIGNVYGWIDGEGLAPRPRAMLAAHMDRIGFLVKRIEKGGFLRVTSVGGFDPRTLPGKEVMVHAKPPMPALFGTKPPHLQARGESEKVVPLHELYLDTGRPEAEVRRRVPIGTMVTLRQPPVDLLNGRIASPGMDDRAGVVVVIRTLELLRDRRPEWDVVGVATIEEEFGTVFLGARTATESVDPKLGIAIDVSHGDMLGAREADTIPLGGGPGLTVGSNVHPRVFEGLRATARALKIPYHVEAYPASSGTDAMDIQIAREGIPTAVLGIPCRYMHSGVETVEPRDVDACARLLAGYLAGLPADWSVTEVLK